MSNARWQAARSPVRNGARTPSVRAFWLRSFLWIASALLGAAIALVFVWASRDDDAARRQIASGAEVASKSVGSEVARIRGLLDSLGSDSDLRDAFISGSSDKLRIVERRLVERVPGAADVHLLLPDQASSSATDPFLSYAGVDLVRQAVQDRAATALEAHGVGRRDVHLAIAAPVRSQAGDRAVGVIHVSFPLSILPSLDQTFGNRAIVSYQQIVGGSAATLRASGQPPDREPDSVQPIPGTRLRVAGWLVDPGSWDFSILAQIAAGYFALLGAIWMAMRHGAAALNRALAQDLESLSGLLTGTAVAGEECVPQAHVVEMRDALAKAAGLVGRGSREQKDQPSEAAQRPDRSSVELAEREIASAYGEFGTPRPKAKREAAELDAWDDTLGALQTLTIDGLSEPDALSALFGSSEIRGVAVRELTADIMRSIGRALGTEAKARGESAVAVGRDCRPSSVVLSAALIEGVRSTGAEAVDLGIAPTPLLYYACARPNPLTGAMVTGGQHPGEYNGVKPVLHGIPADRDALALVEERIRSGSYVSGGGGYRSLDPTADYIEDVTHDVALARSMKVVLDCGNGAASELAPALFRALGCEVVTLNCDMDAGLDDRAHDPANPESARDLADLLIAHGADLGFILDGDGARLGVVDSQGGLIAADRVLMLLAADVLTRHPGTDVVYEASCTRSLAQEIARAGGRPLMVPCGPAMLKARVHESGAMIGGGFSGHIVFRERWLGFDDAIYAGARLLEVLSLDPRSSQEIFAELPGGLATPELTLDLPEGEAARAMRTALALADRLEGVDTILVDGLRAEYRRGWGLMRATDLGQALAFRFEGEDPESLDKIQRLFRLILDKAAPGISAPF